MRNTLEPVYTDISVELVDHMGDDLMVVNAARVSMDKQHSALQQKDASLIRYLAEHNHWSPFAHPQVSFRIRAPIFVARQLAKHQIGLAWNEVSRRYVDDDPTFYKTEPRSRAENVKQGSSEDVVPEVYDIMHIATRAGFSAYKVMLALDVAPEVARSVLPQNMMTEWIWTGSLYAFARVCNLRLDKHAQKESRVVAKYIYSRLVELFPLSAKVLVKSVDN